VRGEWHEMWTRRNRRAQQAGAPTRKNSNAAKHAGKRRRREQIQESHAQTRRKGHPACRSLRNTCRGGRSRNAVAEWFGDRGTSRGRLCGANRSVTIRGNTYGRTNRKRRRHAFVRDIWHEMSTRGNRRAQQAGAPTNAKIEPKAKRLTSQEVSYVDAERRRSSASFVPNREGTLTFRRPR
jgi:hypothetical protein